jgi:hypothetical protein
MGRSSELQQELAQSERHLAEGQVRIDRQAEFVRELYADGHDTTFAAKRLLVLAANLNGVERRREQIVRELSAAQKRSSCGKVRTDATTVVERFSTSITHPRLPFQ